MKVDWPDMPVRFTVDDYVRMSVGDVFVDRRVELINGRIRRCHRQSHAHMWAVSKSAAAFFSRFDRAQFYVVIRGTLYLGKFDAPDPDFHVFDVPEGTPTEACPIPFIVLEIADRSYERDRGIKLRRYAASGVQDYWILNLSNRMIEVYREPERVIGMKPRWRYRSITRHGIGQTIASLKYPEHVLRVADLIP